MDIDNYKSPKIVALEIDEFDEESGVDGIALVEQPAIESDWIYFSSQKQLKDKFNVEDYLGFYFELVDYIDGLPLFTTKEEAEEAAAMFDCEETHEHEIEGFTFFMPCSDHDEATQSFLDEVEALLKKKKNKYTEELPQEQEDVVIEYLSRVGESEEDLVKAGWVRMDDAQEFAISSTPDQPSIDDVNDRIYRYEYANKTGGKATTQTDSRDFCIRIVKLNKLYRKEDINQMTLSGENSQFAQKGSFTYDIFKYAGGKYCKHKWNKIAYKKSNIKEKKQNQIEQTEFAKIKFESNDKQLIAGPLMIPRKLIYRFDEDNGEYWVYFTESVIERISHKYLMNKNQDQTNLEHSESIKLEDVVLVESWLVEDPEKDKSFALTGKTYEKGTWFGIMKVKNLSVWEEWVKTGRVRGYSVEGYFSDKLINMSKTKFYYRTTGGGDEIVIDHKTSVVFILKDGERKAILPDGTYELNNGKTLKVINSKAVEGSF